VTPLKKPLKKTAGASYLLMGFSTNATTPKKQKFQKPLSNLYDGKLVGLFAAAPRQRMWEGLWVKVKCGRGGECLHLATV
jgi:hypothetical protein